MKIIKIYLLKTQIRITFPSEEQRKEFQERLIEAFSNETRLLGTEGRKKFFYVRLEVITNSEIGAMFRLLQEMGYESDE